MPRTERLADGAYEVRISVVDPTTGKRHQPRVRARSRRELDNAVAETRARIRRGDVQEPDTTPLGVWLDAWLSTYRPPSANSVQTRRSAVRRIQRDAVSHIPLGRLRRVHVQELVDRLAAELAPESVRSIVVALRLALDRAERLGVISPGASPADDLVLPRLRRRPMAVWSEDEAARFIAAARDGADAALWLLAIMLGVRIGELLALRWADVDLNAGRLTAARTFSRDADNRRVVADLPKSGAGNRTLRLPAPVIESLRTQRRRSLERRFALGPLWEPDDAVFDDGTGAHWRSDTRQQRTFRLLCETAGLPPIRIHDLRHTAATHMIRGGIPIPAVARILGHSNPAVTLRIYSWVIEAMEDEAVGVIEAMYERRA